MASFEDLFNSAPIEEPEAPKSDFERRFNAVSIEEPDSPKSDFERRFNEVPTEEDDKRPKTLPEKLAKRLEDWGYFPSLTASFANKMGAPDKGIRLQMNGRWDMPALTKQLDNPIANTIAGVASMLGTAAGLRSGEGVISGTEGEKTAEDLQKVMNSLMEEEGATPEQMQAAWSDLGNVLRPWEKEEGDFRTQSDGTLIPNLNSSTFLDENKTRKAIENAKGNPAFKAALLQNPRHIMDAVATQKLEAYEAAAAAVSTVEDATKLIPTIQGQLVGRSGVIEFPSPSKWAMDNNRLHDYQTPEGLRDYENEVINSDGDLQKFVKGIAASNVKGVMKARATFMGLAGMAGWRAAGQDAAETQALMDQISAGAPDAGLTGALVEEAPMLALQIGSARAIGELAGALTKSSSVVQASASFGAVAMSGMQSAGMEYASAINSGMSHEEAQEQSLRAGITTAVITGIFQQAGMGGVEQVAAGKPLSQLTMRDLLKATSGKDLAKKVLAYGKEIVKAYGGEATEEGLDQLVSTFVNADPDTNIATAWEEAEQAFKIGGFIGTAVHIASKSIEGGNAPVAPQSDSFVRDTEAKASVMTPETAQALKISPIKPAAPVAAAAASTTDNSVVSASPGVTTTVGGHDVQLKENTPQALAEAVFGKPSSKAQYRADLDSAKFDIRDIPGSKQKAVLYDGLITDRAYDPDKKAFVDLEPAAREVLAKRQEGRLTQKDSFMEKKATEEAKPSVAATQPAAVITDPKTPSNEPNTPKPTQESGVQQSVPVPEVQGEPSQKSPAPEAPKREVQTPPAGKTEDIGDRIAEGKPRDARNAYIAEYARALDGHSGVDLTDGESGIDLKTGRVQVNAESATSRSIRELAVESASLRSKGDGAAVLSGVDEFNPALGRIESKHPDATPDQTGKLLVAAALNGDPDARNALADISDPDASKALSDVLGDVQSSTLDGPLGEAVKGIANLAGQPGSAGGLFAAEESEPSAPAGAFQLSLEDAAQVIKHGKRNGAVAEYIDSGESTEGDLRVQDSMPIGSVVSVANSEGVVMQKRVAFTEVLPDGGIRHHLRDMPKVDADSQAGIQFRIKAYTPNQHLVQDLRALGEQVAEAVLSGNVAAQRASIMSGMRRFIGRQFNTLVNIDFARKKVGFGLDRGAMVSYTDKDGVPRISVNEGYYVDKLIQMLGSLPTGNAAAVQFALADFAEEVAQTAFHELVHHIARSVISPTEIVEAMRRMVEMASAPGAVRDTLVEEVRNYLKSPNATAKDLLSKLNDGDLVAILSGQSVGGSKLTKKEINEIMFGTGHEFMARLSERLMTGRTVQDIRAANKRWLKAFENEQSAKRQKSRIQTLMTRLSEMGQRLVEAIQRFLQTHRLLDQLPKELQRLSYLIDEALTNPDPALASSLGIEGGVAAPDTMAVRSRTIENLTDQMAHAAALSRTKEGFVDNETKRELRHEIAAIRAARGDNTLPVRLNPVTGKLEVSDDLTEDQKKRIGPLVESLNTNARAEVIIRTSAMANDLSRILRHLNSGRAVTTNSKVTDTFDPARVDNVAAQILARLERGVASAAGIPFHDFLRRLNNGLMELDARQMPVARNGFEPLVEIFTQGAGQVDRVAVAHIQRVGELTRELRDIEAERARLLEGRPHRHAFFSRLNEFDSAMEAEAEAFRDNPDNAPEALREYWRARSEFNQQEDQAALDEFNRRFDAVSDRYFATFQKLVDARAKTQAYLDQLVADGGPLGVLIDETRRANQRATDRALRDLERRQRAFRRLDTLSEVVHRFTTHPAEISQALSDPELALPVNAIESALAEARDTMDSLRRLGEFPAELEYLVIGGKLPPSMQKARRDTWENINAKQVDQTLNLMPLALSRQLFAGGRRDVVRAMVDDPGFEGELTVDDFDRVVYGSTRALESIPKDRVDAFISGVPDQSQALLGGTISTEREVYDTAITRAAFEVQAAARNAGRILGVEGSDPVTRADGTKVNGFELQENLKVNALALSRPLADNLHEAYWRNDGTIDQDVALSGGFPLPLVEIYNDQDSEAHDAELVPRYPGYMVAVPQPTVDETLGFDESWQRMLDDGFVAEVVEGIARFTRAMEADPGLEQVDPLLSHSEGLTPAGLAYQLAAPKLIEFLALTKGTPIQTALSKNAVVADLYNKLAPGLENASAFESARERILRNPANASTKLWDLYRTGKTINSIYGDTIQRLRRAARVRSDMEAERRAAMIKDQVSEDPTSLPVDIDRIDSLSFELKFRRRFISSSNHVLSTLIVPNQAQDFLDRLDSLDAAAQQMNVFDRPGERVVMAQGSNALETRSGIEENEFADWRRESEINEEIDHESARARLRSEALMAIFGGNRELVLRFIHDSRFTSIDHSGDSPSLIYDTVALDSAIREELERMRAEEIAQGVVIDPDTNTVFDQSLRDLSEEFSDHAPALESILRSGGTISRSIDGLGGAAAKYDSSPSSVMSGLAGRITNLAVIEGNARWQSSQDEGRIPTVAFVPSSTMPVLMFPYGAGTEVSARDTRNAVRAMLNWMSEHGGADIVTPARSIIGRFARVNESIISGELAASIRNELATARFPADRNIEADMDAILNASSISLARKVRDGVFEHLAKIDGAMEAAFNPDTAAEVMEGLTPAQAADVLTTILTDTNAKKALVFATTTDPEVDAPSADELAATGDMIGLYNIPQAVDHVFNSMIQILPGDVKVIDDRGVELKFGEDGFEEGAIAHAFRMAEEAARTDDTESRSTAAYSPVMDKQAQWANNLLFDAFRSLAPTQEVPGLAGSAPQNTKLTEMEARQLLATMDDRHLREMIAKRESRPVQSWNNNNRWGKLTAADLMRITGEAADELRANFNQIIRDREAARKYSTVSYLGSHATDTYAKIRQTKGMIAKAESLGAFFTDKSSDMRVGAIWADPFELERADIENGTVEYVEVPTEDGKTERITVWEDERRKWAREKERSRQTISDMMRMSVQAGVALSNARLALAGLESNRDSLLASASNEEFLERLGRSDEISPESMALMEYHPIVRQLFDSREAFANELAVNLVEDFHDNLREVGRFASLSRMVNGRSDLESNLAAVSGMTMVRYNAIADPLNQNWEVLTQYENRIRPNFARNTLGRDGVPSWYDSMPAKTTRVLRIGRRMILDDAKAYNRLVHEAASEANSLVSLLVKKEDFLLPERRGRIDARGVFDLLASGEAASRMARFADLMMGLRDPRGVFDAVSRSTIESAIRKSEWYNPSNGVGSIDLSGSLMNRGPTIEISDAMRSEIQQAIDNDTEASVARVAEILNRHIFPKEEAMQGAVDTIAGMIARSVDGMIEGEQVSSNIDRIARRLEEVGNLDSVSAAKVSMRVLKDAMEGRIAADQMSLETALREEAIGIAKEEERLNGLSASTFTTEGARQWTRLNIEGNPDDRIVTRRVLARYGDAWSRVYLGQRNRSNEFEGAEDARIAAMTADERMKAGTALMRDGTGIDYQVIGDILMPSGTLARMQSENPDMTPNEIAALARKELASPQEGTPAAAPQEIGTKAYRDLLIRKVKAAGLFKAANEKTSRMLRHFDPKEMVSEQFKDMLNRLIGARESGVFKDKGRAALADGTFGPDLHQRINSALANLASDQSPAAFAEFSKANDEVVGAMQADAALDKIIKGFIPGEFFGSYLLGQLEHFDAKVRRLFARSTKAQSAVQRILGNLDYGFDGRSGRNGFRAMEDALARLFDDRFKQINGDKFHLASEGYMGAAIEDFLRSGTDRGGEARGEMLLRMFSQANDSINQALRLGLGMQSNLPTTTEQILAAPKNFVLSLKAYLTEDTYRLLEERVVYDQIRNKFAPIIARLGQGSTLADVVMAIREVQDPEARKFGDFIRETFRHVSSAFIDAATIRGADREYLLRQPIVPFRWQTFNRTLTESRDSASPSEMIQMDRAMWMKSPTRQRGDDKLEMLHINGGEAPMRILSDMLYRMNVAPAYEAVKATIGASRDGAWTTSNATRTLSAPDSEDGFIVTHAKEDLGPDHPDVKVAEAASRAIAMIAQDTVVNDLTTVAPRNRAMDVVQAFHQLGAVKALISASQIWRQTLFGSMAYVGIRNGLLKNWDYIPQLAYYLGSDMLRLAARPFGHVPIEKSYAERMDEFIRRYAPYIYVRAADGNVSYLNRVNRSRPRFGSRPKGRVTGSLRPGVDIATALPSKGAEWSMRAADWMLEKSIASPEKRISRTIFMHSLLRQINEDRRANGEPALSMENLIDPDGMLALPPSMLQQAQVMTTDIMAGSDNSKKGALFQRAATVPGELIRGFFTTFANHQVWMSSNSNAAWHMIRHGDKETKEEGARILASNLTQNVLFQVFKYEVITSLIAGLLGGDDEEKRRRIKGWLHGLDEDGNMRGPMKWFALLVGGSSRPLGYNRNLGEWSDDMFDRDMKQFGLRVSKELATQIPLVGMAASTTLGSSLSEYMMAATIMHAFPGELPVFERAGAVIPERWGGSGYGPESESGLERMAYYTSKFFLNNIASRSLATMGLSTIIDPIAMMANSPDAANTRDTLLLWGSQLPFLPRELGAEGERVFRENTGSEIWAGSWEGR